MSDLFGNAINVLNEIRGVYFCFCIKFDQQSYSDIIVESDGGIHPKNLDYISLYNINNSNNKN